MDPPNGPASGKWGTGKNRGTAKRRGKTTLPERIGEFLESSFRMTGRDFKAKA